MDDLTGSKPYMDNVVQCLSIQMSSANRTNKDGLQTRQVDFEDASWAGLVTLQAPGNFRGALMSSDNSMLNLLFRGIRILSREIKAEEDTGPVLRP